MINSKTIENPNLVNSIVDKQNKLSFSKKVSEKTSNPKRSSKLFLNLSRRMSKIKRKLTRKKKQKIENVGDDFPLDYLRINTEWDNCCGVYNALKFEITIFEKNQVSN